MTVGAFNLEGFPDCIEIVLATARHGTYFQIRIPNRAIRTQKAMKAATASWGCWSMRRRADRSTSKIDAAYQGKSCTPIKVHPQTFLFQRTDRLTGIPHNVARIEPLKRKSRDAPSFRKSSPPAEHFALFFCPSRLCGIPT